MPYSLGFEHLHNYDPAAPDIVVPVVLRLGTESVEVPAKLDTGASFCIFQRMYGEMLGITIESGGRQEFGTATLPFIAFGHAVTLSSFDFELDQIVYFAALPEFPRNVLGRVGWVNQVRIGLIDYESKLYVSRYGQGT